MAWEGDEKRVGVREDKDNEEEEEHVGVEKCTPSWQQHSISSTRQASFGRWNVAEGRHPSSRPQVVSGCTVT